MNLIKSFGTAVAESPGSGEWITNNVVSDKGCNGWPPGDQLLRP